MRTHLASLTIVLASAAMALGQTIPGGVVGGVPIGVGVGGGYGWGHASTAAEGAARGYADVVRSQGMANLANSAAAINYEDARKSYLDNRLKATQTYFEMRRYNTEARRAEKAPPLSPEGYVRLARQQAPAQLSTSQLDPLTGSITWVMPLRRPEYGQLRAAVEKLFHDRAGGYADPLAIDAAIDAFDAQLKTDLAKFAANDYLAAKNFLSSLKFAARALV